MNQRKAEFFDGQAAAPWAADEYGPDDLPKLERLRQVAAIEPGMRLLEPGCGAGRLTQRLADWAGPSGQVVAMDISLAMVKACRRRVAGRGEAVAHHLALEQYAGQPGSFQRIICHQVFPHFDDQPRALAHMRPLLAAGGALVVVHFIDWATINDTHRKAGTVVEGDMMPSLARMAEMMDDVGLRVDFFADDDLGYLLRAVDGPGSRRA